MTTGTLYLIATPIGNLADISSRALSTLGSVDLIAAEDTRHSARLLQHYEITTKVISMHSFNEEKQSRALLRRLLDGESIALISDAGTPLISDPGSLLVRLARESGVQVTPIPGACAAIAALSASGLSAAHFLFEGFLPPKAAARQARLASLRTQTATIILYESPRRVIKLIQDIIQEMGSERRVVIARELTKRFETIYCERADHILAWLENDPDQQKGEFVVLIEGAQVPDYDESEARRVLALLLPHMKVKHAASIGAELTGYKKNQLYELALTMED